MLIKEASQSWKMASNWIYAIIAILTVIQEEWIPVFSAVMSQDVYMLTVLGLAVLGPIARVINQGIKVPEKEPVDAGVKNTLRNTK